MNEFRPFLPSDALVHSAPKNWEKRGRGRMQGLPKFFQYPYYLRNGQSYELPILYAHS